MFPPGAALVTGGGGGIGRATARLFAAEGLSLVLVGRTESTLQSARDEIAGAAPDARIDLVVGNALEAATLRHACGVGARHEGGLTIAVAVVGGSLLKPLAICTEADVTEQLHRNTVSAFALIRAATPHLAEAGGGSIVCISSVAARVPYPYMTPYSAAKAALEGLVRGAALELAPLHIRVNAVRAGLVRSDATRAHLHDNRATLEAQPDDRPLVRVGEPDDIARAVRYLASPAAGWLTGQSLAVDGGKDLTGAPPYLATLARQRWGTDAV